VFLQLGDWFGRFAGLLLAIVLARYVWLAGREVRAQSMVTSSPQRASV
jgi:hypothetical protein